MKVFEMRDKCRKCKYFLECSAWMSDRMADECVIFAEGDSLKVKVV
jgi:hypothetical protein